MLSQMIRFELHFYTRQLTYAAAAVIFLALGVMFNFGGYGGDEVQVNAPFTVSVILSMLSLIGLFVITLFSGSGVVRDAEWKMTELVYSSGVSKGQYFIARFLGLLLSVLCILLLGLLGMLGGAFFVEAEKVGHFELMNYAWPFLVIVVPNVLFCTSLLFAVAVLSQRAAATYVGGVLLFILYLLGSILGNSPLLANASPTTPEHQYFAILLDPFGLAGVFGQARHWSVLQRNTQFIPLQGAYLLNRLLWPLFSIAILALVYRLFSFRIRLKKQRKVAGTDAHQGVHYQAAPVSVAIYSYALATYWAMAKREVTAVFRSATFWSFLALWVLYYAVEIGDHVLSNMMGIAFFPATGIILELLIPEKMMLLLIIFYCGEIVWRDRAAGMHQIKDATPVASTGIFLSKITALALLLGVFLSATILTAVLVQASQGYYRFQPGLYLSLFYYAGVPLIIFGALVMLVQTLVNHKYLGMLISGILVGAALLGSKLGLEHPMLRYGSFPEMLHSDMNGFANTQGAFHWLLVYWTSMAGLFLVLAAALWKRGLEQASLKNYFLHRKRIGRGGLWLGMACLMLFLLSGAYLFYQLNLVNRYQSAASRMNWQVAYEQHYKPYSTLAQPSISKVQTWVDLYPREQRYHIKGTYLLKNNTPAEIPKLLIGLHPEVSTAQITVEGYRLERHDKAFGQYWLLSEKALKPGDSTVVNFELMVRNSAFKLFNKENSIVPNGSYIELEKMLPRFGYNASRELTDQEERAKNGLPAQKGWPELKNNSSEAYNKVAYEAVISTPDDQQIISVGKLLKSWKSGARSYYQFKTEAPVPFMFAIAAANYCVVSEQYRGVAVDFYYKEGHEYNIPTMQEAVKHGLKYMDEHIGPYPYSHLRIVEIPHYPGAATAYPGVVFVKESGYLQDFRDSTALNYAYTIAHEVAHQWWGNGLEPAEMQGYKFLTETMAQYIEHAILEEKWGKEESARFLKNQQDVYLANRAYAYGPELPLLRSEDDHFVHYQKGAVVMNGIKELIGEERLNRALKSFYLKWGSAATKPTSLNLMEALDMETDSSEYALIDFWLNKVFLYDLAIENAQVKQEGKGRYRVSLHLRMDKHLQNSKGMLEPVPFQETIPLGIYNGKGKRILLTYAHAEANSLELVCYVAEPPKKVVIDPFVTRLDENPENNVYWLKE